MKKFLMLASLLACMATITFAEDDEEAQPRAPSIPKVLVLQRYDELQNYNGYDGVVFVRDAGNAQTGQHGDPEVRSGYAIYIWDPRHTGSTKWRKVSKEETLKKVDALDTRALVNKRDFDSAMVSVNQQLSRYQEYYATNQVVMAQLIQDIADIHSAVDVDAMNRIRQENERFRASFAMMTNVTISTTSSFGELKAAVVDIVKAAAKALDENADWHEKEQSAPPVTTP